jgi:hypothetical protein
MYLYDFHIQLDFDPVMDQWKVKYIIIIIIIIGKDTISFMQGIYTYIPETNHVPKRYNVAAILLLLLLLLSLTF